MAIRYTVTRYSFREPDAISEYEYIRLKKMLQSEPSFSLIDPNDTITKNFSRLFKILMGAAISAVISAILFLVGENDRSIQDNGFLMFILVISTLWAAFGLLMFLMSITDLSTYAGYLKKKRTYFGQMESLIRKSKDYDDFFDRFYQ